MLRAIGSEPKAEQAIFWFAYAWHSGKNSDLYRVLRESPYVPPTGEKFDDDPDVVRLFGVLERAFPGQTEVPYSPLLLADVQEGDIIIAGSRHLCLQNRWPCRVLKWEGNLAVACEKGMHRLRANELGFVEGFRR
jgi:hypothetical protein